MRQRELRGGKIWIRKRNGKEIGSSIEELDRRKKEVADKKSRIAILYM